MSENRTVDVLDATAAYELYVPTERLKGVPQRVVDATRKAVEEKGKDGHRLTLHAPTLQPVLTYADDRELRRELWRHMGALNRRGVTILAEEVAQIRTPDDFTDLIATAIARKDS